MELEIGAGDIKKKKKKKFFLTNFFFFLLPTGEWVDECNHDIICYSVSRGSTKVGLSFSEERVLALNVKSGDMYVIEPSLYVLNLFFSQVVLLPSFDTCGLCTPC